MNAVVMRTRGSANGAVACMDVLAVIWEQCEVGGGGVCSARMLLWGGDAA